MPLWPDRSGHWSLAEFAPGSSVTFGPVAAGLVSEMTVWQGKTEILHFRRPTPAKDLPSVDRLMAFRREKQGGARIDSLASLEMKGKLAVGALRLDMVIVAAGVDRMMRRLGMPAGPEITVLDGQTAHRLSAGQPTEEMAGARREEAQRISPLARLRDWRETARRVDVAGKTKLGDEEAWIVRVAWECQPPTTRYVGIRSGLLLKEEAWVTAKGVGTVPLTIQYEDYRDVAGVQIPFRLSSASALTGNQSTQFSEAKANPALNADTFVVPKD